MNGFDICELAPCVVMRVAEKLVLVAAASVTPAAGTPPAVVTWMSRTKPPFVAGILTLKFSAKQSVPSADVDTTPPVHVTEPDVIGLKALGSNVVIVERIGNEA